MTSSGPDSIVGAHHVVDPPEEGEDAGTRHERERRESLREERRLLRWQIICLVLVALFIVVRQLWLT
ncbi:MAG TPA: hypothetical protein VJ976_01415 [Ornithinimicrobium sp.]|uniref:hypothetical protein n=1 Tax=Ornithinimicrobium sp. TaxID=1977084 RepID=UPI002B480A12|nr:hypothetical protein [Ornithinimicrobium sp.]HKJ11027.1 hypothetical protein [Ornithinimicrobium sp.]